MRILVIGCGSIGKRHIGNLQALGVDDLVAFDTREERRAEVAERFEIATVDDAAAAWASEPDAAIIATPPSSHVPLAAEGASNGCHLFIEKPLSHDWAGVEHLVDLVADRRLRTLVGCNYRFHPGFRRLRELLGEGAVGNVVSARAEYGGYLPDWHPWEDYRSGYSARVDLGGGILLDAIHEIDYLAALFGEVTHVACFADKLSTLEIETVDTAALLLRFHDRLIGEVHLDYVQRAYHRSCKVVGETGTILWEISDGRISIYTAEAGSWAVDTDFTDWDANTMYRDEMRHFVRVVEGAEESIVDLAEAATVLDVALAAERSAATFSVLRRGRRGPRAADWLSSAEG